MMTKALIERSRRSSVNATKRQLANIMAIFCSWGLFDEQKYPCCPCQEITP